MGNAMKKQTDAAKQIGRWVADATGIGGPISALEARISDLRVTARTAMEDANLVDGLDELDAFSRRLVWREIENAVESASARLVELEAHLDRADRDARELVEDIESAVTTMNRKPAKTLKKKRVR